MAQFLRPISDITTTEIVGSYTAIDEVSFNDSDYLSSNDNSDATYECGLSSATDPLVNSGHIVRVRWAKADTNVAPSTNGNTQAGTAYLYQGATLIATLGTNSNLGNFTTLAYTLTGAEADSITNYADLRIRVEFPNSGGGNPNNRRGGAISWAEFEIPDVPIDYDIAAEKGSFLLSGKNADLIYARVYLLDVSKGGFLLSGKNTDLLYARVYVLNANKGGFLLSGKNADLIYATSDVYIINANKGSFVLTGKPIYLAYPSLIERIVGYNGNALRYNNKITARYTV